MNHKILVILSEGFEETEAITVIDILRRVKLDLTTASLSQNTTVTGSHNIPVIADTLFSNINPDDFSALILPGGMRGVENMLANPTLLESVKRMAQNNALIAAVCAAPLILDKCGLLSGHRFTCHACVHSRLQTTGLDPLPVIADKKIITGRSAGCAMPWAVEIVRQLLGTVPDALFNGLLLP